MSRKFKLIMFWVTTITAAFDFLLSMIGDDPYWHFFLGCLMTWCAHSWKSDLEEAENE